MKGNKNRKVVLFHVTEGRIRHILTLFKSAHVSPSELSLGSWLCGEKDELLVLMDAPAANIHSF